jgi:hypothetical protein
MECKLFGISDDPDKREQQIKGDSQVQRIVLILSGFVAFCTVSFAEVPEYTAMKAGCRMVMDGFLDEPA